MFFWGVFPDCESKKLKCICLLSLLFRSASKLNNLSKKGCQKKLLVEVAGPYISNVT